jgi:amidohydrolase
MKRPRIAMPTVNPSAKDPLRALRRKLHRRPELSGQEIKTPEFILEYLQACPPDEILEELGGTGMALLYEGEEEGPTLMFRCELDALPIQETSGSMHASLVKGVSHVCGHDGHMAIITGLAEKLGEERPARGRVVLLYQPAEETGEGALQVLKDPRFAQIKPDYVFALHNLPGYPLGAVVVREGVFSIASRGMIVELEGLTAHAAQPETGNSPAPALSELLMEMPQLPEQLSFNDFCLLTPIYVRLGEKGAFGTAPGVAQLMFTLRATRREDMQQLVEKAVEKVKKTAQKHDLNVNISWSDVFESTESDAESVTLVTEAAQQLEMPLQQLETPFRWSEDFGQFTLKHKGALFGLGSGEKQYPLHHSSFDFPDPLLPQGVNLFYQIIQRLLS